MKIMIIGSTEYQHTRIAKHRRKLEKEGHEVLIPAFDDYPHLTDLEACEHNRTKMAGAQQVHIIWNGRSRGTIGDFFMAFAMRKPVQIIYIEQKSLRGVIEKYAQKQEVEMSDVIKSDAKATIESSILAAIVDTSVQTGLSAGKPVERLVSRIVEEVFDKSVLWSVEKYVKEIKGGEDEHANCGNIP